MSYSTPPHTPTIPLEPFTLSIPDSEIEELKTLLKLARIPKETYENLNADKDKDKYLGITREWFVNARKEWLEGFDWRKQEKRINAVPTFTTNIPHKDGTEYTIHFAALFSKKKNAIPILLNHGWPGLYLEFLPILEHVQKQYTPDNLPYHLIVPSLPGYLYSYDPPLDREFSLKDAAYLFDSLLKGLGFGDGYISQGGDLGSRLSQELAQNYPTTKAIHLNFLGANFPPKGTKEAEGFEATAEKQLEITQAFGYALEHATRPSTVGLAIGSNPLSLLAWLGEKYLDWSDKDLSLETILTFTSLYWFTDTYPSSIYQYRYSYGALRNLPKGEDDYIKIPTGYSYFPEELVVTPVHWVKAKANLVWSREHESGGHFAALEKPTELWQDIEEFVAQVWEKK